MMKSSYAREDVCLLLKDITGLVKPLPAKEREVLIQNGAHYCEMLPIEYVPGEAYMEAYHKALESYARAVAKAVEVLGDKILAFKGKDVVLVSLARAGTPIGILLKHYLQKSYGIKVSHYSISIIRGRGIDANAMRHLLADYRPNQLQFVDGWIGKGAILEELRSALSLWPGVSPELGVVADPAYATWLCGTHEDIIIPSSCLNCTVSGLISRTFLREDIIGEKDFHGAVYYKELKDQDLSYAFLQAIEAEFTETGSRDKKDALVRDMRWRDSKEELDRKREQQESEQGLDGKREQQESEQGLDGRRGRQEREQELDGKREQQKREQELDRKIGWQDSEREKRGSGLAETKRIARDFGVRSIYLVKPGIGETTRVLLRRVPWKVLIDPRYLNDASVAHIIRLAQDKGVSVEEYAMTNYKTCGIIQAVADT